MTARAFVEQSGRVTPTHAATWTTNGVLQDGGAISSVDAVLVTGLIYTQTTKVVAETALIPTGTLGIQVYGDSTIGDGGKNFYSKTNALTAGGFQSADGAYWALAVNNAYPFGAVVATNIGAALNTFMAAVFALGGGTVLLPPGTFETSVKIQIPTTVKLQGAGKRSTEIIASNAFPTSTKIIQLGLDTDVTVFDCNLLDITINCNHVAGSIGIYGTGINEGCGCFRTVSKNFRDTGLWYDSCEHFRNEDLEIVNTNTSNNYGIKVIGAVSGFPSGMNIDVEFDRITTFLKAGSSTAGVYLKDTHIIGTGWHHEGSTDGVLIDGDNVYGSINGIEFVSGITNGVHFNGGTSSVALIGVLQGFATNTIKDDLTGSIITDTNVPLWTRRIRGDSPPTEVTTSPYSVLDNDSAIIANRSGNSVGLIFPTASDNLGRELFVKTIQPQVLVSISNDVVPIIGGAAQSNILSATKGAWAYLKCDGTDWVIIAQGAPLGGGTFQNLPGGSYTVVGTDNAISNNGASTMTLTLPTPADFPGRQLWVRTVVNFAVGSDASNIGTLLGGVTSSIVTATAGKWAMIESDGGSFWQIMAAN